MKFLIFLDCQSRHWRGRVFCRRHPGDQPPDCGSGGAGHREIGIPGNGQSPGSPETHPGKVSQVINRLLVRQKQGIFFINHYET